MVRGATAHLERLRVGLGEEPVGVGRIDANQQPSVTAGRDRHVASDQEGEAAEHPLLGEVALAAEQVADAAGEILVVGHQRIRAPSPSASRPVRRSTRIE
jgi:hypothetical protein